MTNGTCMPNWSADPTTAPQANAMASGYCARRPPKITRVAIIAMFQKTGAT
jgi:hypothetical protein